MSDLTVIPYSWGGLDPYHVPSIAELMEQDCFECMGRGWVSYSDISAGSCPRCGGSGKEKR